MEYLNDYQKQVDLLNDEFQGKIKIRAKIECLWFWKLINFILRLLTFYLIKWPDFTVNATPLGKTLWIGSEWYKLSLRNRMLIVQHERDYFRLIWFTKQGKWRGWLYYCWHLFLYLFFPFPCWFAFYRQHVLKHCWQKTINHHIATGKNGKMNRLVYRRLIHQLSGPAFFYAFTEKGAIRAIQNMIAIAENNIKNN